MQRTNMLHCANQISANVSFKIIKVQVTMVSGNKFQTRD